jgi:hypothetical protein
VRGIDTVSTPDVPVSEPMRLPFGRMFNVHTTAAGLVVGMSKVARRGTMRGLERLQGLGPWV